MIEVPIYNQDGQKIETMQVDEELLGGDVNRPLLKQALVMYHANLRQGTARTQARGEVAGSTRKMFKQKGTGNARTGGIRNPIKKGGGHAKQTLPTDYRQEMPVKARRAARDSAVLAKIQGNEIRVLDKVSLETPKTKQVAKIFKALGIDRSCCLAVAEHDPVLYRSARNIQKCKVTTIRQLNAWDIMQKRTLLVTKDGLQKLLA
jgi:large subunit ribosomal protein L4